MTERLYFDEENVVDAEENDRPDIWGFLYLRSPALTPGRHRVDIRLPTCDATHFEGKMECCKEKKKDSSTTIQTLNKAERGFRAAPLAGPVWYLTT
jgi:hypothetical protein